MPHERYYTDQSLKKGEAIALIESEFHHLAHVMRGKVDDEIELIDGKGVLAHAKIIKMDKRQALVDIVELTVVPPPKHRLILMQALPRNQRLDFILEKGTELGMTDLILFPGEKSERKEINEESLAKWKNSCISASKQCGRLYLPNISKLPPIKKWQELPQNAFFGDVSEKAPPFLKAITDLSTDDRCFIVGPESGFTEQEEAFLKQLGATGVSLHTNILRTETAAIAALAILSQT